LSKFFGGDGNAPSGAGAARGATVHDGMKREAQFWGYLGLSIVVLPGGHPRAAHPPLSGSRQVPRGSRAIERGNPSLRDRAVAGQNHPVPAVGGPLTRRTRGTTVRLFMVEVIVCDPEGNELRELGRRFHDCAATEVVIDGCTYEFVRLKAPQVALYRRRLQGRAP